MQQLGQIWGPEIYLGPKIREFPKSQKENFKITKISRFFQTSTCDISSNGDFYGNFMGFFWIFRDFWDFIGFLDYFCGIFDFSGFIGFSGFGILWNFLVPFLTKEKYPKVVYLQAECFVLFKCIYFLNTFLNIFAYFIVLYCF